jgi:RHS repeat-associated protein
MNTTLPDFNYTGLYRHSASNLDFAVYRAYDPGLGRWLNRDPIGESGAINLYGYVLNNPIHWIDRLGLLVDAYFNIKQQLLTIIDRDTGRAEVVRAHAGSGPYQNDPTTTNVPEHKDSNGNRVGGPLPEGDYDILNDRQGRDWYELDRWEKHRGDDRCDECDPIRGRFRLHPGPFSTGCITVPSAADYERVRGVIESTRPEYVLDAGGHGRINYGMMHVFSTTAPKALFP